MGGTRHLVSTVTGRPVSPCAATLTLTAALLLTLAGVADAGSAHARPLRSGQSKCWNAAGTVIACAGSGQDGELRGG